MITSLSDPAGSKSNLNAPAATSAGPSGDDFAPIFISGVHRSGTTWLHQLLVETGQFDYVSAYHVIQYDKLPQQPAGDPATAMGPAGSAGAGPVPAYRELVETFHRLALDSRVIDDVKVSPDLPEEYGFVLDNAGTGKVVTAANLPVLRELCRRIRRVPDGRRPVVLKNPWDAANFVYLKRAIPRARFVFIHRHPERSISSTLIAARTFSAARNDYAALLSRDYQKLFTPYKRGQWARRSLQRLLLSRKANLGVRVVTRRVVAAHRYFIDNIARMPAADCLHLRYEDLCDRPAEGLERVLRFLGLDASLAGSIRTAARPRLRDVLPEVQAFRDTIASRTDEYMKRHGYEAGCVVLPPPPGLV